MRKYLGLGLTIILAAAALFLPGLWFWLRDLSSLNRVQGETLAPLMVAQLDSSYEKDVYRRLSAYFAACNQEDVICSAKEIDPDSEAVRENVMQLEDCGLMQLMLDGGYFFYEYLNYGIWPYDEMGNTLLVERCTQYVLIRESDGQILLVANDIQLTDENGLRMELLLDGLDGTLYYAESSEGTEYHYVDVAMSEWSDGDAWDLLEILNETYHLDFSRLIGEDEEAVLTYDSLYWHKNTASNSTDPRVFLYGAGGKESAFSEYLQDADRINFMGFEPAEIWMASWDDKDVFCSQLSFGDTAASWSLEVEEAEPHTYRARMGFPEVVRFIPEMARRIELPQYDQVYSVRE